MSERLSIFCAGGASNAFSDGTNVTWYLTELMLCYKFGEKLRYKHYLDQIRPYLNDDLFNFFERIYEDSTWINYMKG